MRWLRRWWLRRRGVDVYLLSAREGPDGSVELTVQVKGPVDFGKWDAISECRRLVP